MSSISPARKVGYRCFVECLVRCWQSVRCSCCWNKTCFVFSSTLALTFCVFGANAAERYGEWLLEQPRSSVLTLSFKQSAPLDDKMTTSELGFICDQRDSSKNIAVILIPLDGTFKNKARCDSNFHSRRIAINLIPPIFRKNGKTGPNTSIRSRKANVDELASFLKASETNGVQSVHFFFPNDLGPGRKISSYVAINVSGFSDGFAAFQTACNGLNRPLRQ